MRSKSKITSVSYKEGLISKFQSSLSNTLLWRIKKLPDIAKEFIGRSETLHTIRNTFPLWDEDSPAVVILLGNGGNGKSQEALEYARQAYQRRDYEGVFWVGSCSENTARLALSDICDKLDPSSSTLEESAKVPKVLRLFENMTEKRLLILDNYDSIESFDIVEVIGGTRVVEGCRIKKVR